MTKAYWTKELDTWTLPLKEILKTSYMDKLMNFVTMQYSLNSMLPHRDNLFKHFRNCKYDNVFVVITVPCISHLSNIGRITFDEDIYDYEYGPLKTVARQIELEYHNGLLLDFDYTLKHWGEQGILVLPQSFTYVKLGQSHQVQWNKLFHYILQVFNENKPGTIFLQWGTDLDLPKHNSLKFESPVEQFKRGKDWKFPFKKVDEKIKQLNNLEIQW